MDKKNKVNFLDSLEFNEKIDPRLKPEKPTKKLHWLDYWEDLDEVMEKYDYERLPWHKKIIYKIKKLIS